MLNSKICHCLCLLLVAAMLLTGCQRHTSEQRPLRALVGGTMIPAMEKIRDLYEAETGVRVELDHGDSGSLLARIEQEKDPGDIYVCHDPFLDVLMARGLGQQGWTVATVTPVIVVQKGNPKNIQSVSDLAQDGLRLIVTDYRYSTLGTMLPTIFDKTGRREKIEANVSKTIKMGGQAANDVALGNSDAALVWNAVAYLRRDKLDIVELAQEELPQHDVDAITSATGLIQDLSDIKVTVATLKSSSQPEEARKFAEFVASERAAVVFKEMGYSPVPARLK